MTVKLTVDVNHNYFSNPQIGFERANFHNGEEISTTATTSPESSSIPTNAAFIQPTTTEASTTPTAQQQQ